MKILITEEQLKQWKETFTHCYAETERRITDRAKALSEMQTALDAAEKVEPVNADLATEIEAIDAWYRGDPKYEHDAYWMRDAAKRLVLKFPPLYTHPAQSRDSIIEECANECDLLRQEWARIKVGAYDGRYDMMEEAATACEDSIRALKGK